MESTMNWLPISTAPKDGTSVLLYAPAFGYCYVGSRSHADADGEDVWFDNNYSYFTPSHWMPLPPAPADA